jgi:hypothetical protein
MPEMHLFSNKAVRLLLAVSVSMWMAGGCMFGCANTAMGAGVTQSTKNSMHVPDPGRGPIAALPSFEKQIAPTDNTLVAPFLPNRGPTHLRCCVFLI